jgi:hypothetical protein
MKPMDLNDYLKLNIDVIVDLARKYVPTEIIKEPTFEALAALLMGKFVHRHGSEEEVGKRSQAQNVLAMTMIYSIWCGWVSQSKADTGDYPQEWVDSFKKLIDDAFEIGQKYSEDQPWF